MNTLLIETPSGYKLPNGQIHNTSYGYDKYRINLSNLLVEEIIDRISKKYYIEIDDKALDNDIIMKRNNATNFIETSGREENILHKKIAFGKFRNPQKKLITFFHELGHFSNHPEECNTNILRAEILATIEGVRIAKEEEITFNRKIEISIVKNVLSYVKVYGILTNEKE